MNADRDLAPIPARAAFNSLLAAAAILAVLGLTLALSGCAALRAYSECPPAQLVPGHGGTYTINPRGCR